MADAAATAMPGLMSVSLGRQIGLMVGLAASVALAIAIILWAQKPEYTPLYGGLDGKDASQIIDELSKLNIPYKIGPSGSSILVPHGRVNEVRLALAAQGLPHGSGRGFEIMEKEQGLGTSQFVEMARYRHSLEGELARTITHMNQVRSTRIHLALPKQGVFVRDKRKPSASVFVDLYSGSRLDTQQIDAIRHLVASSIPSLIPTDVTVVDQNGLLLSSDNTSDSLSMGGASVDSIAETEKQFKMKDKIESEYISNIYRLLEPIVGQGRVHAQVSADIDFTYAETTKESFDPDKMMVRSTHTIEKNQNDGQGDEQGVPGQLVNDPNAEGGPKGDFHKQETKNYELDKSISYIKNQAWLINRLSVAVAIDNEELFDEEGNSLGMAISDDALQQLNILVKDAVGYIATRGDSVNVIAMAFKEPEPIEALPSPPIWDSAWFWPSIKYSLAGIALMFILFGVLKPVMKNLLAKPVEPPDTMLPMPEELPQLEGETTKATQSLMDMSGEYGDRMEAVKNMVHEDPGRVAQVVMNWVNEDE